MSNDLSNKLTDSRYNQQSRGMGFVTNSDQRGSTAYVAQQHREHHAHGGSVGHIMNPMQQMMREQAGMGSKPPMPQSSTPRTKKRDYQAELDQRIAWQKQLANQRKGEKTELAHLNPQEMAFLKANPGFVQDVTNKYKALAKKGQGKDTKLGRVSKKTAKALDQLIHQGHKEINEKTGLREYCPHTLDGSTCPACQQNRMLMHLVEQNSRREEMFKNKKKRIAELLNKEGQKIQEHQAYHPDETEEKKNQLSPKNKSFKEYKFPKKMSGYDSPEDIEEEYFADKKEDKPFKKMAEYEPLEGKEVELKEYRHPPQKQSGPTCFANSGMSWNKYLKGGADYDEYLKNNDKMLSGENMQKAGYGPGTSEEKGGIKSLGLQFGKKKTPDETYDERTNKFYKDPKWGNLDFDIKSYKNTNDLTGLKKNILSSLEKKRGVSLSNSGFGNSLAPNRHIINMPRYHDYSQKEKEESGLDSSFTAADSAYETFDHNSEKMKSIPKRILVDNKGDGYEADIKGKKGPFYVSLLKGNPTLRYNIRSKSK